MKHDIKAVIFDADGTILDTRELIYQAYRHVLSFHGYAVPDKETLFEEVRGNPAEITYAKYAIRHDPDALVDIHREFQAEHLDLWSAYEGLHDLIQKIRDAGLKIGICTSRGRNVLPMLEHIGVKDFCQAIVHGDMIVNHKPHPEPLLKVLHEMGVEASDAVMIGDTDADIGAGKAAGVAFTIGITHGVGTREILEEAGADYVVDHLNDVLPLLTKQV
ncbi:MAG TPA: HAD family hydrolase [Candidatus Paceibacterota bacterium]